MKKELNNFFEEYIKKESLFDNKKVLQSNYIPETIPYREKQIQEIAQILAPSLRKEKPSNLFIYGKTGTGKTCVINHVTNQIKEVAAKNDVSLKVVYLNCKSQRLADTEYRIAAQIIRELGGKIATTGLPTKDVYDSFVKMLEDEKTLLILILDEIDQLVDKIGSEILYTLTRMNEELNQSEVTIIGISNSLDFISKVDPRAKSSLAEEELIFPPYNAMELKKILNERVKIGFKKGVIEEGLIPKCAAYTAREHGDARRALELLRVSGELAEREGKTKILIKHLDHAEDKIDRDRILEIIKTNPKQSKITLHSILELTQQNSSEKGVFTGEVYEVYKNTCTKCALRPLTQRRISDIIAELDMLGIIRTDVISKGRFGRTRKICVELPKSTLTEIEKILKKGLNL